MASRKPATIVADTLILSCLVIFAITALLAVCTDRRNVPLHQLAAAHTSTIGDDRSRRVSERESRGRPAG